MDETQKELSIEEQIETLKDNKTLDYMRCALARYLTNRIGDFLRSCPPGTNNQLAQLNIEQMTEFYMSLYNEMTEFNFYKNPIIPYKQHPWFTAHGVFATLLAVGTQPLAAVNLAFYPEIVQLAEEYILRLMKQPEHNNIMDFLDRELKANKQLRQTVKEVRKWIGDTE